MIGRTIGKYRFVERLGRGGMGTVYKAVDETLDREVAIKVLNPELTDDEVMKRFRAEATTLAKLNHPEIATIHEIHRTDSDLLMVMELVRGETLDQLSHRCGPLPAERAAYLVSQILGALEHAHRAGIVHRDLKPANLMVTEHGGVKIMDFGIARVAGSEHLTNDGHMMGTPAYMAPEQVMAKDVDGRADIYACGVVFYRLLTGNLPFEADTAIGMVQKQLSDEPTPVHTHRADLPDWCGHVLTRALAKSPADRYQTAAEFQFALQAAISSAATEHTGVYAASRLQGLTPPPTPMRTASVAVISAVASATPVAQPAVTAPAVTQSVVTPPAVLPPPAAPAAVVAKPKAVTDGPTIVLQRNHFAVAGGLLAVVAIGVVVLAFLALRRPASAPVESATTAEASAPTASTATPETPTPPVTPAPEPPPAPVAATTPPASEAAPPPPAPSAPPVSATPAPKPTATPATTPAARKTDTAAATANKTAVSVVAPATPVAPAPVVETVAPFAFEAKTVVVEAGKNREREANVVIGDGRITVTDKQKRLVSAVPYDAVLGLFYSNSKQPMWNSPSGPAEAVRVEAGAFGFLKGGRNWVVMHTKDASVVLRVEDDQTRRVLAAIEERSGHKVERIVEPKGR